MHERLARRVDLEAVKTGDVDLAGNLEPLLADPGSRRPLMMPTVDGDLSASAPSSERASSLR